MKSVIQACLGGRVTAMLVSSIRTDRAWPAVLGYGFAIALIAAPLMRVHAGTPTQTGTEAAFLAENQTAMNRMMTGMEVTPSGDVDRDFAAMMIPHHQGAVDMAQAELRYGHNEALRRIAEEIVAGQPQEIVKMRQALGQNSPTPATATHIPAMSTQKAK
jgi:hypothetical protein